MKIIIILQILKLCFKLYRQTFVLFWAQLTYIVEQICSKFEISQKKKRNFVDKTKTNLNNISKFDLRFEKLCTIYIVQLEKWSHLYAFCIEIL